MKSKRWLKIFKMQIDTKLTSKHRIIKERLNTIPILKNYNQQLQYRTVSYSLFDSRMLRIYSVHCLIVCRCHCLLHFIVLYFICWKHNTARSGTSQKDNHKVKVSSAEAEKVHGKYDSSEAEARVKLLGTLTTSRVLLSSLAWVKTSYWKCFSSNSGKAMLQTKERNLFLFFFKNIIVEMEIKEKNTLITWSDSNETIKVNFPTCN